jgi:hypothetical protein
MTVCQLFSGGLDSACLWWIMDRPPALFVGGPFGPARDASLGEARAVERMAELCPEFRDKLCLVGLDCRPFMRPDSWLFPRDELCALLAWGAGFDGVALGWCKDDGMTEARVQSASEHLRQALPREFPFSVSFPAWNMTKKEMVRAALGAGASREFLAASYSCVMSSDPCGACVNCKQRTLALEGV